jgi:hypothetical protein
MRRLTQLSWPVRASLAAACLLAIAGFGLFGPSQPATSADIAGQPAAASRSGELIYVPIYSSIFYEDGRRTLELAATLSVHNVDPDRPLTLARADYYDTSGTLIKKYVDKPMTLKPLETKNIVIERSNTAGGPGANFLVAWESADEVSSPLIEAVMVNTASNLGIAFTTTGRVVRRSGANAAKISTP